MGGVFRACVIDRMGNETAKVGNRHRIPYTEFARFLKERWDQMIGLASPGIEAELFGGDE